MLTGKIASIAASVWIISAAAGLAATYQIGDRTFETDPATELTGDNQNSLFVTGTDASNYEVSAWDTISINEQIPIAQFNSLYEPQNADPGAGTLTGFRLAPFPPIVIFILGTDYIGTTYEEDRSVPDNPKGIFTVFFESENLTPEETAEGFPILDSSNYNDFTIVRFTISNPDDVQTGPNNGNLASVSVFSAQETTSKVPLPASGFLMVAALGGVVGLRRLRTQKHS